MRRKRRGGFVLLLAIVMIAIAALLLAGVARQSFLLALQGADVQEELQRRWGVVSCQQAILAHAEDILAKEADRHAAVRGTDFLPPAAAKTRLVLGGMQFDLLLADENAKVNLNAVAREQDLEFVRRLAQEAAAASGGLVVSFHPRRTTGAETGSPLLESWGQVFALGESRVSSADLLVPATAEITCFGTGRINVFRAPDRVVDRIASLAIGPEAVEKLLSLRKEYAVKAEDNRQRRLAEEAAKELAHNTPVPASAADQPQAKQPTATDEEFARTALSDMLGQLRLRQGEQTRLSQLITHQSTCHSLWITISAKERTSRSLYIREPGGRGACFTW